MAKQASTPVDRPEASNWRAFAVVGICGLLIGSTGTYLILLPELQRRSAPPPVAAPANVPDPLAQLPTADLTAGLPPAQADRTLGNFYYDHQNWAQAIRSYESAIKQGSDDADIRTDLGNAYRFSRRPDDALAQYRTAQRMNPAHETSLFNQGGVYLEDLQQPQMAVQIWNEYLTRFPQGTNAAAARQLVARAGLPGAATTRPSSTNAPGTPPGPTDAEVQRLLRLVPASPAAAKP